MLAYFCQHYGDRVEIDENGQEHLVSLREAMQREYLHLAWSRDGRHFEALNGNHPTWPEQWMRDPFVNRGADGRFHLVATGPADEDGVQRSCVYAVSDDLITWEKGSLPLMRSVPEARNVWAPEWFFDASTGEYLLLWSSSFRDAGWKESRLWSSRTRDWKTFIEPQIFFEPTYSVIDGSLWEHEGTYYLFHKEEEFGAVKGERRAIRLATSKSLNGPWSIIDGPLNDGQIVPVITEGPSIQPDPLGDGWLLLYDFCMGDDYGISHSKDLVTWDELRLDEVSFPDGARHGCTIQISEAEFSALQKAFPTVN
ncbi:1,4-beta-xylanase [bacterium]|nr:MAG: 1,4-beta-xylanase [bacterium]